ncbi:type I DNA topoisomerase [Paracrocinitomix mangrovi]|uniref:type I DNA topoisomerase n=1 Tax=Paracrocinitomix mangrovi TaxID=2862509 RepID=UPI001C8F1664|nr:type I DNA topoisomerase [Paracrocinitomix mangrovi]UKN03290.1 type I DNA topoisomerase [Paracrocinitomix mangrovi]
MAKNLVIVESPAKAKTIEKYLGKDFVVKSSMGHVRDLAKGDKSIDVEQDFAPKYIVSTDKKKVITELKKLAKDAEMVWLASDEDREGEAISWHLKEALGLKPEKYKRITFNEITKTAVLNAIENPREIDADLVNAQQARRILDRLVGFELSPVLWRKVKPSLSAGRVQSVAVRLIVERELEIEGFTSKPFYRTDAIFKAGSSKVKAKLGVNFNTKKEAKSFVDDCNGFDFKVNSVTKKPAKKSPTAPFTTSTLQQEASLKLGYSVSRTMSVAQKLYEAGHITYMRTDSVNLSKQATDAAQAEITKAYGAEFHQFRTFKTKSAGAQEAHEAIRPTDFSAHTVSAGSDEEKLYQLIWKRAIASQMSEAQLERTAIKIQAPQNLEFTANGEVIKFEGFLKVYLESNLDEDEEEMEGLLPDIKEGESLQEDLITSTERFTRPPARYVEASLVKKLEELGIGRPSTYAPTISTIQKRGYVEKGEKEGVEREYIQIKLEKGNVDSSTLTEKTGSDKGKLIPTDIGRIVTEFLIEHFGKIMDYGFTASVEKEFDDIAQGMMKWTEMIKEFYGPFHENVEHTIEHSERATGERMLGVDPKTGRNVYARIGRFGPMIQIGEQDDEEKPVFASLQKDQSIQTIQLDEALELFKYPKVIGEYEGKPVKVNKGRFGPYVQIDKTFVSIKEANGDTLEGMTIDRAIELIEEKREEDKNKVIKIFEEDENVQLLNGRYGAYLKIGKNNFRLPKDVEPSELTYEQCIEISQNQAKGKKKKK